jgi:hypothetical protein
MRGNKVGVQFRSWLSSVQLIEQHLGLLQIERVEAFSEPGGVPNFFGGSRNIHFRNTAVDRRHGCFVIFMRLSHKLTGTAAKRSRLEQPLALLGFEHGTVSPIGI